jgi:hypothetical protein
MARAVIALTKTETRRTRNLKEINKDPDAWHFVRLSVDHTGKLFAHFQRGDVFMAIPCPYGKPGDVLWVRESFYEYGKWGNTHDKKTWLPLLNEPVRFVADDHLIQPVTGLEYSMGYQWRIKPSIHMPKAAARIWLQVEEIKVERLQDITEESAIKEGIIDYQDGTYRNYFTQKGLREQDGVHCILAKGSFQSLWCSINGLESWDANPWVWVVKFKVLSTTGKPTNPITK